MEVGNASYGRRPTVDMREKNPHFFVSALISFLAIKAWSGVTEIRVVVQSKWVPDEWARGVPVTIFEILDSMKKRGFLVLRWLQLVEGDDKMVISVQIKPRATAEETQEAARMANR